MSTRGWILTAVALEIAALLAERMLVVVLGKQAIAAAMLTAPASGAAVLGACAVLARIAGHALIPAAAALVAGVAVVRWAWRLPAT